MLKRRLVSLVIYKLSEGKKNRKNFWKKLILLHFRAEMCPEGSHYWFPLHPGLVAQHLSKTSTQKFGNVATTEATSL